MKIAILLGAPLSQQNLERTGILALSAHFEVAVFNCLPWLGRSEGGMHHENAHWEPLENIASAHDLEAALLRHRPDYALDFIGLCSLTPEIQRLLVRARCSFVVQKGGSLPSPSLARRLAWRLRLALSRHRPATVTAQADKASHSGKGLLQPTSAPGSLLSRFAARLSLQARLLPPDLALVAGKASLVGIARKARHVLWTASQDYHIHQAYKSSAVSTAAPAQPYVVFIDDNLPYASDWSLLGIKPPVTPHAYYPALRRVLSQLESAWGMPVIVAGHPSGKLDERLREGFGRRPLLFGQTAALVSHAQAVLLHASTALSFAVLDRKPLLFLTSDELRQCSFGLQVQTMAGRLGLQAMNIDSGEAPPDLASLPIDAGRYQAYIEDFLCASQAAENSAWQAFIALLHERQQSAGGKPAQVKCRVRSTQG